MDAFEIFFRQADTDGDGRISGAEGVTFFRATGLPQIALAKIWQLSDQAQRGFLTKPEFVHALKLVTLAQSGSELTPEVAQAALMSTQILPPRIVQTSPLHAQQPASVPQYRPPLQNQPVGYTGRPQSQPATPTWTPNPAPLAANQTGFGGTLFQTGSGASKPSAPVNSATSGAPGVSTSSALPLSEDLFGSKPGLADAFGGGTFTADEKALVPTSTLASAPTSLVAGTAIVPVTPSAPAAASSSFPASTAAPGGVPASFVAPATSGPGQAFVRPSSGPVQAVGRSGQGVPAAPGATWPKMSQGDVERYTKVFVTVDTDRDGKITGDQARYLFLSWRLPRDVLKQIWDLSDQDGDSMLSLREFCIALYFMERYREGRPVPPVLPTGFLPEASVPQPQPSVQQPWQGPGPVRPPGLIPHRPVGPGAPRNLAPGMLPVNPAGATGPVVLPGSQTVGLIPMQASPAETVAAAQSIPYKSRVPPLEIELVNQLSKDDQATLKSKHQEAEAADRKVFELDKDIKKSGEMIEFYRAKLQEIILFKTRSDNQLLEVSERLSADRREVDKLRKRYDLKFQQAGESNSRLQAEEVAFRDIQQRKMEVYNAIAKLDQSGKKEDLQARAEEISADLNELKVLLNQRAKSLGVRARPTSAMELPFGWQPGIQEKAVDWDGWDNFEDDGFTYFQGAEETKRDLKETDNQAANGPSEKASETEKPDKPVEESTSEQKSASEDVPTMNETSITKEVKSEEATPAEDKKKEREATVGSVTDASAASPSWSSVFGDEPAWNLSQDFGKMNTGSSDAGGIMGLKSIKTSAPSRAGDASVPETPLFKASHDVPETPLFSTVSPPKLDYQQSMRGGDESVPDTPLFKSPDEEGSRDRFARFDSFGDFGRFDDAGSSSFDNSNRWSTF